MLKKPLPARSPHSSQRGSSNGDAVFRSRHAWLFARNFFRHPRMLGSIIPSSRFLINHLINEIDFERSRCIVEYGPGIGNITKELLERMRPDSLLVAIETNEEFVAFLKHQFHDPRLYVLHRSAAEVSRIMRDLQLDCADYIISGIPYSTMPIPLRNNILRESRRVLRPEGAFIIYQFSNAVLPHLQAHFRSIRQEFEPRNVLPARLFYCTK
jgi:phospholipid N-methyltransferase